ncbi:MAG: Inner membrane protein, KefB/KefC family [uncultured Chloroflexia bacterium]|uniref:Inner membrane protein, KefB/KefC family n=1 Tax=uncultured Chloroflexia bacterium TaxID=1672391 RepID=A0A6J4JY61_9CHLR|nr:MAG: Inner membrane protein, KefB/KefC family [uncultured Chloroflexia bacterium]
MAAEAPLPFLAELVALLAASALIAYLGQRIGLVPIVGFLLAGVLIGPSTLGLVRDQALIHAAAEIGVILLLFTIGLEFSLEHLARIRRLIFVGGGLQVGLVVTLVTLGLLLFGVPWKAGVFTGCLLALSSTAVVMKLLADSGQTNSPAGQIALGILIFQDLAVVAMVLLVPMLGGTGGSVLAIAQALGTAVAIIAAVLIVARRVMPRLMEAVARTCSQEIFLLTVVAICFGTAYVTSLAGVSLSLGAFLAGLLVSDTRFKHYALGEILPLQVLFSATFFVSVGLLLDVRFLLQHLLLVLAVVAAILLLKVVTTIISVRALGYPRGTTAFASLLLAQIGEFSLVLERAGGAGGLTPAGAAETGTQTFIAATVLLIVLTPFLAQAGEALQRRLAKPSSPDAPAVPDHHPGSQHDGFAGLSDHVIVAGYGPACQALAPILQQADIPYGILTLSPGGANDAEQAGLRVMRNDYTRQQTLLLAGIMRAKLLVIADDNPAVVERVVAVARSINSHIPILVRTRYRDEAQELMAAGADHAISEEQASILRLLQHVLGAYKLDTDRIAGYVDVLEAAPDTNGAFRREQTPVRLTDAARRVAKCAHVATVDEVVPASTGCEECLRLGDAWVHLRVCMTCGHVGCCDSSKHKHATQHFHATEHPVIRSLEPGEDWGWCHVDRVTL